MSVVEVYWMAPGLQQIFIQYSSSEVVYFNRAKISQEFQSECEVNVLVFCGALLPT